MSVYGYCRISTAKQSIDRQVRNIMAEYPTAHIVQEAYTGTSILRPEWSKLYRILKKGDTVVFDSVSRMSRNAEEGFSLYEDEKILDSSTEYCICAEFCACDWNDWRVHFATTGVLHNHG